MAYLWYYSSLWLFWLSMCVDWAIACGWLRPRLTCRAPRQCHRQSCPMSLTIIFPTVGTQMCFQGCLKKSCLHLCLCIYTCVCTAASNGLQACLTSLLPDVFIVDRCQSNIKVSYYYKTPTGTVMLEKARRWEPFSIREENSWFPS